MKALLKIVKKIINNPRDVDFNDIKKLLESFGYECTQPKGGSRHFIFRKKGVDHFSIPKKKPVNEFYVKHIIKLLDLRSWYEENKQN